MPLYFSLKVADGILSDWGWNWRRCFSEIGGLWKRGVSFLTWIHWQCFMSNQVCWTGPEKMNLNCWFAMTLCLKKRKRQTRNNLLRPCSCRKLCILDPRQTRHRRSKPVRLSSSIHFHLQNRYLSKAKAINFETFWQVGLQSTRSDKGCNVAGTFSQSIGIVSVSTDHTTFMSDGMILSRPGLYELDEPNKAMNPFKQSHVISTDLWDGFCACTFSSWSLFDSFQIHVLYFSTLAPCLISMTAPMHLSLASMRWR